MTLALARNRPARGLSLAAKTELVEALTVRILKDLYGVADIDPAAVFGTAKVVSI